MILHLVANNFDKRALNGNTKDSNRDKGEWPSSTKDSNKGDPLNQ